MSAPNINLDKLNKLDSNMQVSNQYFTEDEILKSGGIIYDPSRAGESGPSVLPDAGKLLDTVAAMMEYMATDEVLAFKKKCIEENKEEEYEFSIEDQFPEFTSKYFSLFKMIVGGEDLTPMYRMFACIDQVNKGHTTLESVEKQLGEELADEFVKPITEDNKIRDGSDWDGDDEASGSGNAKKKRKKKKKKKKK